MPRRKQPTILREIKSLKREFSALSKWLLKMESAFLKEDAHNFRKALHDSEMWAEGVLGRVQMIKDLTEGVDPYKK